MWVKPIALGDTASIARSVGERRPDLVLLFGATDQFITTDIQARLLAAFPNAIHLGCSSGTLVAEGKLRDDGVAAIAVGFDRTPLRLATHALATSGASRAAGHALGQALAAPDLRGVFVLSDGLNVNGSDLVAGLVEAVGPDVALSGGLAGDGATFQSTVVSVAGVAKSHMVSALGFYGSAIRFSHGSAGGWDEFGPVRRITRSVGNELYELDGKPALDLYTRYLGEEAAALPASALIYPLKVWNPASKDDEVVRTVLSVHQAEQSMTFAGDIPEGWHARLMRGSFDRLSDGAADAARHARRTLEEQGVSAELCLLVSCVGRRLLMGQRTEEEIEAVAGVLGATPLMGFYSYGEIAPNNRSGVCGLHNQTMTVTLLSEAA